MSIVLYDPAHRKNLYPFTYTRAFAELRTGILTRYEWWKKVSGQPVFLLTESYLQTLYKPIPEGEHLFIDASLLPDAGLCNRILLLPSGRGLVDETGKLVAARTTLSAFPDYTRTHGSQLSHISALTRLEYPWQLFQWNHRLLSADFELLTKGRRSQHPSRTNRITGKEQLFIEEGAKVEMAFINAQTGPVYIGKNVEIMEGACIRGPFAACKNSVIKMGTKVYGATTLGPWSMIGGEVKNSILMGYSNKAHDGYLGDSVLGYWCNIGGGTSNSNLKNTAGEISFEEVESLTGSSAGNKCGVFMGDYTRTAVNSCINTGSVYGTGCNIFGAGLLPRFIGNFAWGAGKDTKYRFGNAMNDINRWKKFKNKELGEAEISVLQFIFEHF